MAVQPPHQSDTNGFLTIFCHPRCIKISVPTPPPGFFFRVDTVKEIVARNLSISLESLPLFGIFMGQPERPLELFSKIVPENVSEVSFMRLPYFQEQEREMINKDHKTLEMVAFELEYQYKSNMLLPLPKSKVKHKLDHLLNKDRYMCHDSQRDIVRVGLNHPFYYTTGTELVTCQREISKQAISLSEGVVAIRLALNMKGIAFFEASGQSEAMIWPWSTIVSCRLLRGPIKLFIFYIAVEIRKVKFLRPIIVQTVRSPYIYSLANYFLNLIKSELRLSYEGPISSDAPYYLQSYRPQDDAAIHVEGFSEAITSVLIQSGLSKTAIGKSNLGVKCDYQKSPPFGIYTPSKHNRLKVTEMNIRTLKMYFDSKEKCLNLQVATDPGEYLRVSHIKEALGKCFNLSESENVLACFHVTMYIPHETLPVQPLSDEVCVCETVTCLSFSLNMENQIFTTSLPNCNIISRLEPPGLHENLLSNDDPTVSPNYFSTKKTLASPVVTGHSILGMTSNQSEPNYVPINSSAKQPS